MRNNQIHMKYGNLSKFNSHIPFLVWETCTFFLLWNSVNNIPANFLWVKCVRFLPCHVQDFRKRPGDFRRFPMNFWRLLNVAGNWMFTDAPKMFEHFQSYKKMTLILAYFDFVRTQKRTQSHHVVKNNLSGFVGQTNCPWCIRSMYLVHRRETHA